MARHIFALAAISLLVSGCAGKYNALRIEHQQALEQLNQSQQETQRATTAAKAYKDQLDALMAQGGDLAKLNANLNEQIAALKTQNAELESSLKRVSALPGEVVNAPVNPALTSALEQLAAENAPFMEFDAARGVIKLKSDVTFDKGSAELTPRAKDAIRRLATVLNSAAAREYEFQLVGHTDITPVSNPATLREGHKDNWYLSAHRAIAVERELARQGIGQHRMGVAGYAEQRPVASNASTEGMARNRRVEVMILPSSFRGTSVAADPSRIPAPNTPAPNRRPNLDLNKDTALDRRPIFNK